jgi:hypothetical protein
MRVTKTIYAFAVVPFVISFMHLQLICLCAYGGQRELSNITCSDEAIRLSTKQLLKLVNKQAPIKPPGMLHDSKLHGFVTVEICLDRNGQVAAIKRLDGHTLAVNSVIDSVRTWSFSPYKLKNQAMPIIGVLKVKYDFRGKPTSNYGASLGKCC